MWGNARSRAGTGLRCIAGICTWLVVLFAACRRETKCPEGLAPEEFVSCIVGREMERHDIAGLSIAVIDEFETAWARGYGTRSRSDAQPVTETTLFQAGSISKPVAAVAALRSVEEGKLQLDQDINKYLKSWKLPENELTREVPVTLRHLLAHRAGINVHGFGGYAVGEEIPTLLDILDGRKPANSKPIRVVRKPGEEFRYSGGGYCVVQQALEDIYDEPFARVMERLALDPLEMSHSTFEQPVPENLVRDLAAGHWEDEGEEFIGHRIYPEMAAAGLWTTPSDLAKLMIEIQLSFRGRSDAFLGHSTTREMLTPQAGGFMGLGMMIDRVGDEVFFSHTGENAGFRAVFVAHCDRGDGVVVMANSEFGREVFDSILDAVERAYGWDADFELE